MTMKQKTMILGNNAKAAEKELKDLGITYDADFLKLDKEVAAHTYLYILVSKVHNKQAKTYSVNAKRHAIANARYYAAQIKKGQLSKTYDNVILVHNPHKQEENGK